MGKPLVKEVREFDPKIPEENQNLIKQFTEEGVDTLVEYYNQKYPERGQIHRVMAPMNLGMDLVETEVEKSQRCFGESRGAAIQGLEELRRHNPLPLKIILTTLQQETSESEYLIQKGRHSIPLVITDSKLILLRDDAPITYETLTIVAQNLGLEFVRPRALKHETLLDESERRKEQTSMQSDRKNCNGIAVAILKDLTQADMANVVEFENGYVPTPKMLKYAQSETFILKNYPELADQPVSEEKPITLMQYVRKHTRFEELEEGSTAKPKKIATRITDKMERMREDMMEQNPADKKTWVKEILEKRAQDKELKNEGRE